jgi:hypothetical protein
VIVVVGGGGGRWPDCERPLLPIPVLRGVTLGDGGSGGLARNASSSSMTAVGSCSSGTTSRLPRRRRGSPTQRWHTPSLPTLRDLRLHTTHVTLPAGVVVVVVADRRRHREASHVAVAHASEQNLRRLQRRRSLDVDGAVRHRQALLRLAAAPAWARRAD